MANHNPEKCLILATLREDLGLNQKDAAKFFGMRSRDSIAAWEQGTSRPHSNRRARFIVYLWDKLLLRQKPEEFKKVWRDIVVEEWRWQPLTHEERRKYFTGARGDEISVAQIELGDIPIADQLNLDDSAQIFSEQSKVETRYASSSEQPHIDAKDILNIIPPISSQIQNEVRFWVSHLSSKRIIIQTTVVIMLLLIGWSVWSFLGDQEIAENLGRVEVVGIVNITPPNPQVGDIVTAEVQVHSKKVNPYKVKIGVSGRGPNACSEGWSASIQSWPEVDIILEYGETYTYKQSQNFNVAGNYFAETGLTSPEGEWTSISPHPSTWFDVLNDQGQRLHPDCIVVDELDEGLAISSSEIQMSDTVTLTYTIRNDQVEIAEIEQVMAGIREKDTEGYYLRDIFPISTDITLQPGETFTYRASRKFNNPGEYVIRPFLMNQNKRRWPIWPYPEMKLIVTDRPVTQRSYEFVQHQND